MEQAFRDILTGDAAVAALATGGVNWGAHPQGQPLPAVVLFLVSGAGGHTLDGPNRLFEGRVQIDCYAQDYGTAKRLSRAVIAALDGHAGGVFQRIFWASSRDLRDATYSEAAERPFRMSLDFLVTANV
ncbi:DUF3168 domain-containing protein [Pseudooceanicola nanhaiensis]|uniref:DUF3168 domain-containing protein n=1 Tax=Pseudooceanicola nanhaiensis TaxID=375761 RepID=UPI003518E95F